MTNKGLSQKVNDYAVCPKCKKREWKEIPKARYVFLISSLPWLVAIVASIMVNPIFLILIPLIGYANMKIVGRKTPLSKCQSCHYIGPTQPTRFLHT